MSTQVIPMEAKVVRTATDSLDELVPLIQEKIKQGESATTEANRYFFEAGAYLERAKPLVFAEAEREEKNPHTYWAKWVWNNFQRKDKTIRSWIQGARRKRRGRQSLKNLIDSGWQRDSAMEDFEKKTLSATLHPRRHRSHRPRWHLKVKPLLPNRYDIDRMRVEKQAKQEEEHLQHELGLKLVDIGYKVLADKLHPDHGGSSEAMARLNRVRDKLKGAL